MGYCCKRTIHALRTPLPDLCIERTWYASPRSTVKIENLRTEMVTIMQTDRLLMRERAQLQQKLV